MFLKIASFCLILIFECPFARGTTDNISCHIKTDTYYTQDCERYWDCTAQKLLGKWTEHNNQGEKLIFRKLLANIDVEKIGHTPMWLRVRNRKLYCIKHPDLIKKNLRMKIYRALHYVNRINRILIEKPDVIPEGTEWWSHHSDWNKILDGSGLPPVFSVSGIDGYADIAGIPFMSFSDKHSVKENLAFASAELYSKFHFELWKRRKSAAFFRGSLSDCSLAVSKHAGDIKFCARAKIVFEAKRSRNPILEGISTTSEFHKIGLNTKCDECKENQLNGTSFIGNLLNYKYLLNFPGAGKWSRRMSLLLRSGGAIFQAENQGYQFYDFNLKPGLHYIPFDSEIGKSGAQNLISRLNWAEQNDEIVQIIGSRSSSFGINCLSEQSIDNFMAKLLSKYSNMFIGDAINLTSVDLSLCRAKSHKESEKIARLCRGIIEKCWN